MKILNLFKAKRNTAVKGTTEKLNKKQLEKVIGGEDKERGITINTTHVEWSK